MKKFRVETHEVEAERYKDRWRVWSKGVFALVRDEQLDVLGFTEVVPEPDAIVRRVLNHWCVLLPRETPSLYPASFTLRDDAIKYAKWKLGPNVKVEE